MADKINSDDHKVELPPRPIHDTGSFIGQCVDVIDLGKKPETYEGQDKGAQPKMALVFRTGETYTDENGDTQFLDLSIEYTISVGRKATLRKHLEAWRGKQYEEEYPSVPLDKFEGVWANLSVGHKTSAKGNKYAVILGIAGLPKGYQRPESFLNGYTRADFWAKRKAEYQKEYEAYLAKTNPPKAQKAQAAPAPANFEEFPGALEDEDDDLPF